MVIVSIYAGTEQDWQLNVKAHLALEAVDVGGGLRSGARQRLDVAHQVPLPQLPQQRRHLSAAPQSAFVVSLYIGNSVLPTMSPLPQEGGVTSQLATRLLSVQR